MKKDYKGYVYIVTNEGYKDSVKIGYSTLDPKKRAKELSNAGTIHPCIAKYEFLVENPRSLEQATHKSLKLKREVENREWFRCTLAEAIAAIKEVAGQKDISILYEGDVKPESINPFGEHPDIFAPDEGTKPPSQDFVDCFELVKQGNLNAQYRLGLMYQQGQGVDRDYPKAIGWYREAAEQNYIDAQVNLGRMLYNVSWLHKNYNEAVKWFSKAAEQNNADAQYYLANMYQHGQGVTRNLKEAENWYVKALKNGDDEMKNKVVRACLNKTANATFRPDL